MSHPDQPNQWRRRKASKLREKSQWVPINPFNHWGMATARMPHGSPHGRDAIGGFPSTAVELEKTHHGELCVWTVMTLQRKRRLQQVQRGNAKAEGKEKEKFQGQRRRKMPYFEELG